VAHGSAGCNAGSSRHLRAGPHPAGWPHSLGAGRHPARRNAGSPRPPGHAHIPVGCNAGSPPPTRACPHPGWVQRGPRAAPGRAVTHQLGATRALRRSRTRPHPSSAQHGSPAPPPCEPATRPGAPQLGATRVLAARSGKPHPGRVQRGLRTALPGTPTSQPGATPWPDAPTPPAGCDTGSARHSWGCPRPARHDTGSVRRHRANPLPGWEQHALPTPPPGEPATPPGATQRPRSATGQTHITTGRNAGCKSPSPRRLPSRLGAAQARRPCQAWLGSARPLGQARGRPRCSGPAARKTGGGIRGSGVARSLVGALGCGPARKRRAEGELQVARRVSRDRGTPYGKGLTSGFGRKSWRSSRAGRRKRWRNKHREGTLRETGSGDSGFVVGAGSVRRHREPTRDQPRQARCGGTSAPTI
jgi:hypothetical protein